METLNLDKVRPDDKTVIIGKKEYKIPGDIPVGLVIDINKAAQRLTADQADVDALEQATKTLCSIFQLRDEGLKYDKFRMMIGSEDYAKIVNYIFNASKDNTLNLDEEKKSNIENSSTDTGAEIKGKS